MSESELLGACYRQLMARYPEPEYWRWFIGCSDSGGFIAYVQRRYSPGATAHPIEHVSTSCESLEVLLEYLGRE